MQQPTLTDVRIRSTRDALQIFYAVARKILPMTTRRLDAEERRAIVPGNVYVWEERCANAEATGLGMERWTDGMGWGPSRVRDEFLFYHQRESDANDDPNNPSAKWASIMKKRDPRASAADAPGPSYSRIEAERLIKQTYSVHVTLPEDRPLHVTRKWHLTAYFSQTTLDSLNTIDKVPGVGDVPVPPGLFRSARASKTRRTEHHAEDTASSQDSWALNEYAGAQYNMSHFPVEAAAGDPTPTWSSSRASNRAPLGAASSSYQPYPPDVARAYARDYAPSPSPSVTSTRYYETASTHYRDPSPFSTSTAHSTSPTPPPFPTQPRRQPRRNDIQLVPLEYLESISPPVRDAVDDELLRRISTRIPLAATPSLPALSI
ncbi:hypothetical protein K474DRAFT_1669165 [Panus rudis PR-1116 ss-1]|nr:hypothetical protein K474DRAFT_1669165 [Panus rudis PR-1116 ss-1]